MSDEDNNIVQVTLENLTRLQEKLPQAIQSFSNLSQAALHAGIFDKRTKEIMALAIAIAVYSKGCIKFHLQNLIKQNLSYDELMEIIAVVTYMNGGVGLIAGTKALKYFDRMQSKEQNDADTRQRAAGQGETNFRDNITKGYD